MQRLAGKRRLTFAFMGAMLLAQPARAETIDFNGLDEATRVAIKEACHGWVFQDAADRVASWIDAVSPLCDAEEAARLRALAPPMPPVGQVPGDAGGTGSWDPIRVECRNEYMCVTQRRRGDALGRPVSLAEYQRVADHCGGEYWCIEAAFGKLPELEIPGENPVPAP